MRGGVWIFLRFGWGAIRYFIEDMFFVVAVVVFALFRFLFLFAFKFSFLHEEGQPVKILGTDMTCSFPPPLPPVYIYIKTDEET